MKTLHFYLAKEILATMLMTVVVFTFVLLLGNLLKEIAALMASGQISPGFLFKAIGLLIPFVLVYSLPMGLLTATLLVFGRFSSDQELTAARAGGISLLSLTTPIFVIGVLMSFLCGWINLQIGPQCRLAYKNMIFEHGLATATALVQEKSYTDFPPNYRIYVNNISSNNLQDVTIYQYDNNQKLKMRMNADKASLEIKPDTQQILLTLHSVDGFEFNEGKERTFVYSKYGPMTLGKKQNNKNKVNTRGARFFSKKGCFFCNFFGARLHARSAFFPKRVCFFLHFFGARLRRAPFSLFSPFIPLGRACGAPFSPLSLGARQFPLYFSFGRACGAPIFPFFGR